MLEQLMARDDGPLVRRLPREAGKRELRYAHCFSAATQELDNPVPTAGARAPESNDGERLDRLEQRVNELQTEIEQLKDALATLHSATVRDDV